MIEILKSLGMTGCIGSESIEFTIMSEHATGSGLYKWNKDGKVENLKHPFEVRPCYEFFKIIFFHCPGRQIFISA